MADFKICFSLGGGGVLLIFERIPKNRATFKLDRMEC